MKITDTNIFFKNELQNAYNNREVKQINFFNYANDEGTIHHNNIVAMFNCIDINLDLSDVPNNTILNFKIEDFIPIKQFNDMLDNLGKLGIQANVDDNDLFRYINNKKRIIKDKNNVVKIGKNRIQEEVNEQFNLNGKKFICLTYNVLNSIFQKNDVRVLFNIIKSNNTISFKCGHGVAEDGYVDNELLNFNYSNNEISFKIIYLTKVFIDRTKDENVKTLIDENNNKVDFSKFSYLDIPAFQVKSLNIKLSDIKYLNLVNELELLDFSNDKVYTFSMIKMYKILYKYTNLKYFNECSDLIANKLKLNYVIWRNSDHHTLALGMLDKDNEIFNHIKYKNIIVDVGIDKRVYINNMNYEEFIINNKNNLIEILPIKMYSWNVNTIKSGLIKKQLLFGNNMCIVLRKKE